MSQLDQAKREAARLLKLAKKNDVTEKPPFKLPIKNLSHAREHIANINGYQNWNVFEKELNKKDAIQSNTSDNKQRDSIKRLLSNTAFFNRDIPFIFNPNNKTNNEEYKNISKKEHKPIKLGDFHTRSFYTMKESFLNKSKEWVLTSYPVTIAGATGAGKTASLLSLGKQYIENGEGLFYIDGKCENSTFTHFHNIAEKYNRLDDFYLLNFMMGHNNSDKITHTIDPINPLIGDEQAFKILFGDKIGVLIHELSKCIKENDGLVSIENIESFFMLGNIKSMSEDPLFLKAKNSIDNYLSELSDDDFESCLNFHVLNCEDAFDMIEMLTVYKSKFSIEPEIDLEKAYYKSKLVLILFPSLEKNHYICKTLLNLFMLSLNKTIKEFNNESTVQNVIIDDIASLASNKLADYVFATSLKSANIIYGIQDYERQNNYLKYITQQSKTFVLMKMETGEIPNDLKIKIMDNLEDFPPFYKAKHLRFQYPGEAMVFGDNNDYLEKKTTLNYKKGYTFSSLKLVYEPVKGSGNNYYLNKNSM